MDTGYLLMNISKKLKYTLNQALIEKGITIQQWAVIQQLSIQKECTAVELASILDMDKPTVSGIVKRLELKGLLIKKDNPLDQRSSLLSLTESGNVLLNDCRATSERIINNYLAELSSAEQQLLNQLLMKINQKEVNEE
ncbi:MarR family transcriptional regulator [Enterococcus raffinosus]|uniref:MarR family winged helix-turn-helix transcriptional regulator n=1 Tax=Enterococcus raffinosus TaxID=71452 RepID=UPI001C115AF5|nr:MarR family transcriptional regulator [Enterococcus raffinosus]MBU5362653.1 MarR family transcriptional regulator [Enterococcus raffinosus]